MGYILPLVPLLSIQDSTLQLTKQKRYSYISSVEPISKQPSFEKEVSRKVENYKQLKNCGNHKTEGMISRQEDALAKEIAEVTGKGRHINYFI